MKAPSACSSQKLPVRTPVHAPTGIIRKGSTKDGEIIHAAFVTPNWIGSVRQPPRRSPSMSAKSFVVVAPSRNSPKIAPRNQGSKPMAVFTEDQPATFSSTPLGTAIVTLAQMPRRFVRNGGTEYSVVIAAAATTIQKHSCRPPGATFQARTNARAKL